MLTVIAHRMLARSLDTLFARMLLLSAAVLFALHAGWMMIAWSESALLDDAAQRATAETLRTVDDALGATPADARSAGPMTVDFATSAPVALPARRAIDARPRLVDLRPRFVAASYRADGADSNADADADNAGMNSAPPRAPLLRAANPDDPSWIVAPVDVRSVPRAIVVMLSMGSAVIALSLLALSQWRALGGLTCGLRETGAEKRSASRSQACEALHRDARSVRGPRELRRLHAALDEMQARRRHANRDEAETLAAVAARLSAPLDRLAQRVRAIDETAMRDAFIGDIDAFGAFVGKLREYAGEAAADDPPVSVDAFLREHAVRYDAALIALNLHAGNGFALPRATLDRLVTNLIDNALEHGAPPVHILTTRTQDTWRIEVRDCGAGIAPDDLPRALQPFVRLNANDDTRKDHCGLGLAIVARLARSIGGTCGLNNHPEGGLRVTIDVPVAASSERLADR